MVTSMHWEIHRLLFFAESLNIKEKKNKFLMGKRRKLSDCAERRPQLFQLYPDRGYSYRVEQKRERSYCNEEEAAVIGL